ncbi:MAG: HAMP domain-containing protein [Gammaproteobacteria bacterium]|nr:MAG: HAMP domain-containing protein [Gammaproteobacteria bacterium]
MAAARLKGLGRGPWPMLLLFVLLLVSLTLMSDATHNSERFGRLYSWLLLANAVGLVVLAGMILVNLLWLYRQRRRRAPGARLTSRLVGIFVLISLLPVLVVYYFSLQFLLEGIDSWFDVQIEQSLEDALDLARSAFDVQMRERLHLTEKLAEGLTDVPSALAAMNLFDLRVQAGAAELTLYSGNGRIIASSGGLESGIVPTKPAESILAQVRSGHAYVGLEPGREGHLRIQAVVPVPAGRPTEELRVLQALYEVPERLSEKAARVEAARARYRELAYLRRPLKQSYTLTLSLVLGLSLLSAVWAAFHLARRLVEPVRELAEGTQAIADGDYTRMLRVSSDDELGFLVKSFNMMTQRLRRAREQAERHQAQIERQRAYLEALLASLSSGVISIDREGQVRTMNEAAARILGVERRTLLYQPFVDWSVRHPQLAPLQQRVLEHLRRGEADWSDEVTLDLPEGRRTLMVHGARMPAGQVLVLDDITALIQAQRNAAWGEVARRLAHEIKNPLTPIQLSAERLRRKYLPKMEPSEGEVLDRATYTIVQQVEAMKEMVNAFADYARAPRLQMETLAPDTLVRETLDLYRDTWPNIRFETDLRAADLRIQADRNRLRQLLHNLLRNAVEAIGDDARGRVRILTRPLPATREGERDRVELCVEDNGPGFAPEMLDRLFEPYVTTKSKGTGLGLAIVRKIADEHHAEVRAGNVPGGGARLCVRFPVVVEA